MGMNAPRDQQRAPQPDIFWRRRVVALALGIAILGLLAWAVSGVVGGGAATRQTADVGPVTPSGAPPAGPPAPAPRAPPPAPAPPHARPPAPPPPPRPPPT